MTTSHTERRSQKFKTEGDDCIWNYDDIIKVVLSLKPKQARRLVNGQRRNLCVSPLICAVRMRDGHVIRFNTSPLIRACYIRVSSERQRSGHLLSGEDIGDDDTIGGTEDGWSEIHQLERLLDYCTQVSDAAGNLPCIAFYNDASLSGRLTTDDFSLVQDVNSKHAALYREVFTKVLLAPSYIKNLSHIEVQNMIAYRDNVAEKIEEGFKDAATTADIEILKRKRRHKRDTNLRPAMCELVHDIEDREIGEVLFTDLSRLSRSMTFLSTLFGKMRNKDVKLTGLVQSLSDTGDSTTMEVLVALMGWMGQMRIRESILGYFQGALQHLEAGKPMAPAPFWATTNGAGDPVYNEEAIEIVHQLIEDFKVIVRIEDDPSAGITTLLRHINTKGVPTPSQICGRGARTGKWSYHSLKMVLISPAIGGYQMRFGRMWKTLRPLMPEEEFHIWQRKVRQVLKRNTQQNNKGDWDDRPATRLFRCVCGKWMTYREGYLRCYRPGETQHSRVYLREDNVARFLDAYMSADPSVILTPLQSSAERLSLEEERERLEGELNRLEDQIQERVRAVRPTVEAGLASINVSGEHVVEQAVLNHDTVKAIMQLLESTEARVVSINRQLANMVAASEVEEIETRLKAWGQLEDAAKNHLIRRLFDRFQLAGSEAAPELVPVLKHTKIALAPVPINLIPYHGKYSRRLPETVEALSNVLSRAFDA